jgi:hypothetical protein
MSSVREAFECVAFHNRGWDYYEPARYVARCVNLPIERYASTLTQAMRILTFSLDNKKADSLASLKTRNRRERVGLRLRVAFDSVASLLKPQEHAHWKHTPQPPRRESF